jgi:ABC-type polysaccharide/polyol phosphate export permease
MIFISGTFYSTDHLPKALQAVATVLPLKHVIDGFIGALVTGRGLAHHVTALAVLGVWCAGGVLLAVRWFRWE